MLFFLKQECPKKIKKSSRQDFETVVVLQAPRIGLNFQCPDLAINNKYSTAAVEAKSYKKKTMAKVKVLLPFVLLLLILAIVAQSRTIGSKLICIS